MSASARDTTEFFDQLTNKVLALRVLSHQRLRPLTSEQLNRRPGYDKWSAAQCLEHLNLVGGYYLPNLKARLRLAQASGSTAGAQVRSGWLGRYFTSTTQDRNGLGDNLLRRPKQYAPTGTRLTGTVVESFNRQLDELLRLLLLARQVDAGAVRIPNPLYPWLRLRLTDVFEALVIHLQRYVKQAEQVAVATANK
ncbi:DinB family protein [Hymenobacter sp. H14-R3]|uniref:DinB family protein n=1 Tax=Hymenobacter sp. H14-R3 TaxID=3046308 RepID=UPI0024BA7E30|nr:DinB family protein [Hymenobacter sp. H14-R3]MDJ0365671.1 DinB family protein [Hymenobacter sp. H14-R3]